MKASALLQEAQQQVAGDKHQRHTSDEDADEGMQGELPGQAGCVPFWACDSWLCLFKRCLCCLKEAACWPAMLCTG